MIHFQQIKSDHNVPLPKKESMEDNMMSQLALQQAQFQANQQKLNSQLALQLAQLTVKEGK